MVQEVLAEDHILGMARRAVNGADTMVVLDGEIFGKFPLSLSDAKRMLRQFVRPHPRGAHRRPCGW